MPKRKPGHRCEHLRPDGKKCPRRTKPQEKYCSIHCKKFRKSSFRGGAIDVFGTQIQSRDNTPEFKKKMGFFRKHIGPKLTELLDEALAIKMFDVSEELAIIRSACIQHVQIFNSLHQLWDCEETRPKTPEAIDAFNLALAECSAGVKAAMNECTFQVERQAKIHSMVAEKIHPNAINDVVRQINRMVFECFGQSDWKGVERFNNMLTTQLELPSLKNQGTTITPDQQVRMMDDSVPLYVEEVEMTV